ncbi:MAG: UDP-glucuronic acid decarboxylase family protein [Armatimonadota bacterium]|nr:SDR family oxidoreductase [bacterium]
MKHAFVTGGAGFLGSHLCDLLLKNGFRVTAMDNLLTGNTDNIAHHAGNPNFKFVRYDVTNDLYIDDQVDVVFHFASPASPVDYQQYPIETLKVGSIGTHKALGLARAHGATFLLASTSEVYGDPLIHPQNESYWGNVNPIGPRGVYDEAKRFAEALTMAYHNTHGLDTRIVRIFNTYGPRMRLHDGRVVPEMIYQALTNQPLTVFGDGSQTRSFCFVEDEVKGILKLYESGCNDPVNIGNPHEMTILQFAEIIRKLIDTRSEIVFRPLPVDDPTKRQPDISKARELLDWEPRVPLEEGLSKTIAYFQSTLKPTAVAAY